LIAHQVAQLDIRTPGLFGSGSALVLEPVDLFMQGEKRLERLRRHGLRDAERIDAERLEGLPLHRALESDLGGTALIERPSLEHGIEADAESARNRLQLGELRLALSGLDHRHLA